MVGNAGSIRSRAIGRIDAASDSQQRRTVEFRAIHVFEYSQGGGAVFAEGGYFVGNAAAGSLRRLGVGARWPGAGDQAEVAVCDRPALGLVAGAGGDCHADVGGGAVE